MPRSVFWCLLLALLLVPVLTLFPIPIDETRYLTVAWNMFAGGHWLVPWRDGAAYPDKPPLLFWMINLGWLVTGAHVWSARLVELIVALATLPLLAMLARRLGATREAGAAAAGVWLATLAFSSYAGAIMFDLLLTDCALLAWLGAVALACGSQRRGVLLLSLGLGLGILAKGPVSLLVGALPALMAPWWNAPIRQRAAQYYLWLLLALVLAVALALVWALPAAYFGGTAYADAIFLHQTVGRVDDSFAHARSLKWYLPILPALLLPWPLVLGRGAERSTPPNTPMLDRFAMAAFVPAFLAFCLISGKQPHYLLPLLPALALIGGIRLAEGRWRIVRWRLGAVVTAIAVVLGVALPSLHPQGNTAVAWIGLAALLVLGLALMFWRSPRAMQVIHVALVMAATTMLTKLAFAAALWPRYEVQTISLKLAAAQQAGIPLLHITEPAGLFGFAGRTTQAIPSVSSHAAVAAWVLAHPDGWVIGDDPDLRYCAIPIYRQPFLDRDLSIWRARDITPQVCKQPAHSPVGG